MVTQFIAYCVTILLSLIIITRKIYKSDAAIIPLREKTLVDLGKMASKTQEATITKYVEETHIQYLVTPERVQAFVDAKWSNMPQSMRRANNDEVELYKREQLGRMGITVYATLKDGMEISQHFLIPKGVGMKSNLRNFIEMNKLEYDSEKWLGKTVEVRVDDNGYWKFKV